MWRLAQQIHRIVRRRGHEAAKELRGHYDRLIGVAEATRRQVERVRVALHEDASDASERLVHQIEHFVPLVDQVLSQARRRVLKGEAVPAKEKFLILFEPYTQLHVRQKPGKAVEFGTKLLLNEVEGGIVSHYQVLPEPGTEHPYFEESLRAHQAYFGKAPDLPAADRGLSSAQNEALAREAGVKRVVLPRTGRVSAERRQLERSPAWRRAWRKYALERCLDRGERGMGRWIGWGILTHNLVKIAQSVAARTA